MSERVYTGGMLEEDLLGKIEREDGRKERGSYLPFKAAIELVKNSQPGDPTDPEAGFANDLHTMVAEKLGLEDYSHLKFYTAVGSELDLYHGIDAFFEIDDPRTGKIYRLTLDITLRSTKEKMFDLKDTEGLELGNKADQVIAVEEHELDRESNREGYDGFLEEEAESIAEFLLFKRDNKFDTKRFVKHGPKKLPNLLTGEN